MLGFCKRNMTAFNSTLPHLHDDIQSYPLDVFILFYSDMLGITTVTDLEVSLCFVLSARY